MKRYKKEGYLSKKPANTVRVTRPSKYGNMFKIYQDGRITLWNRKVKSWKVQKEIPLFIGDVQDVVNLYEYAILQDLESIRRYKKSLDNSIIIDAIKEHLEYLKNVDFTELHGKNVECSCDLDKPCHGDILLKHFANFNNGRKGANLHQLEMKF